MLQHAATTVGCCIYCTCNTLQHTETNHLWLLHILHWQSSANTSGCRTNCICKTLQLLQAAAHTAREAVVARTALATHCNTLQLPQAAAHTALEAVVARTAAAPRGARVLERTAAAPRGARALGLIGSARTAKQWVMCAYIYVYIYVCVCIYT